MHSKNNKLSNPEGMVIKTQRSKKLARRLSVRLSVCPTPKGSQTTKAVGLSLGHLIKPRRGGYQNIALQEIGTPSVRLSVRLSVRPSVCPSVRRE